LVEASGAHGGTVARRFEAPGTVSLDLNDTLDWVLEAKAPGFWSPPQALIPGRGAATLTLYPAARLSSTLDFPDGGRVPPDVRLRLQDPRWQRAIVVVGGEEAATEEPSLPEATIVCPVVDSQWACTVPAGTWDTRVRAESYISHYFWELRLPAGKTVDLERLRLEEGASIVGRVAVEEGALPDDVTVALSPSRAHAPTTRRGLLEFETLSLSESVNERGYFVLAGMQPGAYRLEASAEGFVAAVMTPVPVYENAESELTSPLVLSRPLEVDFMVSPPLDPQGRQWAAHLLRWLEIPGRAENAGEHVVNEDGTFTATDLAPGEFLIRLIDGTGRRFAAQDVSVFEGRGLQHIELPIIGVEGEVLLGDEPLLAEVYFGGRRGSESIRVDSDEEGAFSGYLPREGLWLVEVRSANGDVSRRIRDVRVRADRDGVARVELVLPSTYLAGRVIDENGVPVPGSRVVATELASQSTLLKITAEEGEFLFMGLGEGPVSLEAEARVGNEVLKTENRIVALVEGLDPGLQEIVARRTLSLEGRVLGPTGHGVPGASIVGEVTGTSSSAPRGVGSVTGVGGGFTLELPSDAVSVDAWAFPMGCSLSFARIDAESTESADIQCNDDAGTLRLEYPQDLTREGGTRATVLIMINGAPLGAHALYRWAELNGEPAHGQVGRLVVPQMPAGDYALCLLEPSRSVQVMSSGELTTDGCSTGYLRRNGSLSLAIGGPGDS
jgi:hypothetical protein